MIIRTDYQGSIAIVTIDNPPVNALSQAARQALWDTVISLDGNSAVVSVILICAGRTFIAGADVSEFGNAPVPPYLPDLVARIENAKKPWIAALHGSALGGGFEIALGCRFRVALASASIGLPEVTLGIVPGAGGTVRTPRLAGAEAAVELIATGKPIRAPRAKELGLIDAIIDGDLLAGAIDFAENIQHASLPVLAYERIISPPSTNFWDDCKKTIAKRMPNEDAPLRALACIRFAVEHNFLDALAFERKNFLELRSSAQAIALRHVFFAERSAPRPKELNGIEPKLIHTVAVIGGGTMGAGIAAAFRDAGLPVILIERDDATLERGLNNVHQIFDGNVKRGRISAETAAERMAGLTGSTDYTALAEADLVVEAVFEDLDVKRAVFVRLGEVCRADTILATNTSYLDPRTIAEGLTNPDRFLGLHFFSPAHVMKLLEIIPIPQTNPSVVAAAFALARTMGKIPVRAGICDGFIGNRMLKVTRAQAERVLLAGATPAQIDAAMRSFGMPMGPFEAQDLGGLDIAAFQRKAARERGETPFAPIAERLCALGRFGQKSKAGWYDYADNSRVSIHSPIVAGEITAAATLSEFKQRDWNNHDIIDCIVLPMVNEGARILEEHIALRASDIDLVKIHGYGFPRWRGGLIHWAETGGLSEIVEKLELLARDRLAELPCAFLKKTAENGNSFTTS